MLFCYNELIFLSVLPLERGYMALKINNSIISIPPYISAHWSQVAALHMADHVLAITLVDGSMISIPGLANETIESIFSYHAAYLEKVNAENAISREITSDKGEYLSSLFESGNGAAFRFGFGSMDGFGNTLQHNPSQANAPDLPAEVLQKISAISKILSSEEISLPKAEPSCNCFHCQVARALNPHATVSTVEPSNEESVEDKELEFQQWTINQTGDKLFSVINRLDSNEKYNVYLGEPIGCTCGKQGCEHIVAVLKS